MCTSHLRLELYLVERRRNPLHPGHRVLAKGNTGLISAHQHGLYVGRAAKYAEQGDGKEALRGFRQWTKAVTELCAQRLDLRDIRHVRHAAVDIELSILRVDVLVRQIGRRVD